jgi:DNA-binding response OmpR family regulator
MPPSGLPLVLVVDDDPDLRKLISEFLAAHGFRVATAENSAAMRQFMHGTSLSLFGRTFLLMVAASV